MNNIVIHGRLTRDPELKTVSSGKEVCNFCVAVGRRFKGANGEEKTDYFECEAWGSSGVFVSTYFRKGKEIIVRGEMQQNSYENKEGQKRTVWKLVAETVSFCGSKKDKTDEAQTETAATNHSVGLPDGGDFSYSLYIDDELPF